MSEQWEIVVDDHSQAVRRCAVPGGWIYETQTGRGYSSAPRTVGRMDDRGYPIWGPGVFVPNAPATTSTERHTTMNNIFEYATRNKFRFASVRGELTVEQLWDVPLRSRDNFDLNTVAKTANKALKEISEESFVETTKTALHTRLEISMEVIKHVIDTKLTEEETAKKRAANKQEKEKLLQILAEKQDGKLSDLSEKELQKRIAALGD